MRLDHSFTVPVPVEEAWEVLLDVPRVAPCMPGAALTNFDGERFDGTVKVKVGPITLTYSGKGRFVERDEAARRVVVEASGRDTRASGTASATVTATLVPDGSSTRVEVATDLTVTGKPAQFGRGMLADVGGRLIGQFADCLAGKLAEPAPPAEEPSAAAPGAVTESSAAESSAAESSVAESSAAGSSVAESSAAGSGDRAESSAAGSGAQPESSTVASRSRPESSAAAPRTQPETEVEPIDLLQLSAGTAAARYAGLVALSAGAAVLTWLVIRALRR